MALSALTDPMWGDEPAIESFDDVVPGFDHTTTQILNAARLNNRAIPIDSIEARCWCLCTRRSPAPCTVQSHL